MRLAIAFYRHKARMAAVMMRLYPEGPRFERAAREREHALEWLRLHDPEFQRGEVQA